MNVEQRWKYVIKDKKMNAGNNQNKLSWSIDNAIVPTPANINIVLISLHRSEWPKSELQSSHFIPALSLKNKWNANGNL